MIKLRLPLSYLKLFFAQLETKVMTSSTYSPKELHRYKGFICKLDLQILNLPSRHLECFSSHPVLESNKSLRQC